MIIFKTINKFEMCIYEGRVVQILTVYASDIFCESTTIVFLNVRIEITSNIFNALCPSYFLNEFQKF